MYNPFLNGPDSVIISRLVDYSEAGEVIILSRAEEPCLEPVPALEKPVDSPVRRASFLNLEVKVGL